MKSPFLFLMGLLSLNLCAQDLSALYEKVNQSVVVIRVLEEQTLGTGDPLQKTKVGSLGSGVVIDVDGTIITASHVVNNATQVEVEFVDGTILPARVHTTAINADVAMIKLKDSKPGIVSAKLGDSDKVKVGEQVVVIGAPHGLKHSFSSGYISGRQNHKSALSDKNLVEFFQTDASINTGNSGGPMFNLNGEVIGIVSSILTQSGGFEGIGFAATSNIVKSLLIERNRYWFGMDWIFLPPELASILNVPQLGGVLIQYINPTSPAYYACLKGGYLSVNILGTDILLGGDIILSVGDIQVLDAVSLEKAAKYIDSLPSFSRFPLEVLRGGEVIKLEWYLKE